MQGSDAKVCIKKERRETGGKEEEKEEVVEEGGQGRGERTGLGSQGSEENEKGRRG